MSHDFENIGFLIYKCIKVEYKYGYCGHFGTWTMSVAIVVLEIQHVHTSEGLSVMTKNWFNSHNLDMPLVPKYPQ